MTAHQKSDPETVGSGIDPVPTPHDDDEQELTEEQRKERQRICEQALQELGEEG